MASRGAPRMPLPTRSTSRTANTCVQLCASAISGRATPTRSRSRAARAVAWRGVRSASAARQDLQEAVDRFGGAFDDAERDGGGAEHLGQEERQDRIDGLGRGIGRQADPSEQPDRPSADFDTQITVAPRPYRIRLRRSALPSVQSTQWSPWLSCSRTRTREGELYERLPDGRLRCYACGHCCPLPDGAIGVCKVRFNEGGRLRVPWGYVGGVQCDPIEKKPFFHAYPGALAYSFGMLGCDLHCGYCQNWVTSQALRDPAAARAAAATRRRTALVRDALRLGARVMVSTYNEPLITSEWAVAIFKEAKAAGLATGYVSNGNGTPEVLEYLRPWVDLYKVDLKSFDDRHYRQLGGRLAADSRHDPAAARDGLLARDRDAADSRASTTRATSSRG